MLGVQHARSNFIMAAVGDVNEIFDADKKKKKKGVENERQKKNQNGPMENVGYLISFLFFGHGFFFFHLSNCHVRTGSRPNRRKSKRFRP